MIILDLTDDELAEMDDGVATHLPFVRAARELRRRRTAETVVPPAIAAGLHRYAKHGIEPGSCLLRILQGDLFGAFASADPYTRPAMGAIVDLVTSTLHASVYGSPEAVSRYLADCLKLREAFERPFPGSETP
jgi:hypothetical protein